MNPNKTIKEIVEIFIGDFILLSFMLLIFSPISYKSTDYHPINLSRAKSLIYLP
ncbi:MAG: hypothetical protein PWQ37_2455 [Candidatus Petromonas sp.]|jgi:hypothetical protein|nr:hypothetical protein [Candidatus Petromonas sp.]